METIKNIKVYHDLFELFDENTTREEWDALSDGIKHALEFMDAFESFEYALINYDTVLVLESGDVSGEPQPLEEFKKETINYIIEEGLDYED